MADDALNGAKCFMVVVEDLRGELTGAELGRGLNGLVNAAVILHGAHTRSLRGHPTLNCRTNVRRFDVVG